MVVMVRGGLSFQMTQNHCSRGHIPIRGPGHVTYLQFGFKDNETLGIPEPIPIHKRQPCNCNKHPLRSPIYGVRDAQEERRIT